VGAIGARTIYKRAELTLRPEGIVPRVFDNCTPHATRDRGRTRCAAHNANRRRTETVRLDVDTEAPSPLDAHPRKCRSSTVRTSAPHAGGERRAMRGQANLYRNTVRGRLSPVQ